MSFLITGLPRSGTTWLANFMTYEDVLCYHEAGSFCVSGTDYAKLMRNPNYGLTGNSDSGALGIAHQIREYVPETKLILIDRDPLQVREALEELGLYHDESFDLLCQLKDQLKEDADMIVQFDDIWEDGAAQIWEFVTGLPVNEDRLWLLRDMDIQTPVDVIMERAKTFWRQYNGQN